jgi:hypothetical protein
VSGPDIQPVQFKTGSEARDWCIQHYPGSPIRDWRRSIPATKTKAHGRRRRVLKTAAHARSRTASRVVRRRLLRVRNHGAVVGAPVPHGSYLRSLRWRRGGCWSRAGVETIACARPSPRPSQPVCAAARATAFAAPLRTAVVAKTIMVLRNIRRTPLLIAPVKPDFHSPELWCELSRGLTILAPFAARLLDPV